MIVLGGNMRLKACKEAGLKEVPIIIADNLTEEQVSVVSKLIKEQINEIEPFEVVVSNSLIFLNIQKPKVLSLKIISSELNKFGTQLITLLDELDFITNDHREYIPHLTLGRIKATLNDYEKDKIASIQFNGNMIINAFHLFESLLTSTGPKYNIIEEYKL